MTGKHPEASNLFIIKFVSRPSSKGLVIDKITDRVLKETHVGYKSHLEEVWSPIVHFLEDLQILPPEATKHFFSKLY